MTEMIAAQLASNLRRLREARGWTQQQLADNSGVPRPTLAHLESGDGNPTLAVLMRVALALSVTLEALVEGPSAHLRLQPADSMPTRVRGHASARQLWSDTAGLEVERLELRAGGRCSLGPGSGIAQQLIACESGRLEIAAEGESYRLRPGDALVCRGEVRISCNNPGARLAVLYVTTLAPAGLSG